MRNSFLILLTIASACFAQPSHITVQATQSQAVISYQAPDAAACSIQVADMNRGISIASGTQAGGTVTLTTTAPHGLLYSLVSGGPALGTSIYLEGSGVSAWDGWQVLTSAGTAVTTLGFASATSGSATGGSVGVLIDDVNPTLYPGSDQDSRTGNTSQGSFRQFVLGQHNSPAAADGNRYSRALQVASRHIYTLTCTGGSVTGSFTTANAPVGMTLGTVPPVDPSNNQYGYATIQWGNQAQALIDPITGLLSRRATAPADTASASTAFVAALDPDSCWTNASGPLTSGTATFTAPCGTNGYLFLRADNLAIGAGATYQNDVTSALDWVQVSVAGAKMQSACSGNDCVMQACLTVNGVSCATPLQSKTLTTTGAAYTFGTTNLMDLWQGSGAPQIASPDVSRASGLVSYTASTKVLLWSCSPDSSGICTGGSKFNTHWTAGSRITVAGTEYPIASVQSELQLTLASGPGSDIAPPAAFASPNYSGNNFGLLVKKQTATANTMSVGPTAYTYGSSPFPFWDSSSTNTCSRTTVNNAAGKPGYNCFVSQELFWIAADGSAVNDLGLVQTQWIQLGYPGTGESYWGNVACGESTSPAIFDPLNADIWYCSLISHIDFQGYAVVQGQYLGDHSQGVPGQVIRSCDLNGNTYSLNHNPPPCLRFIQMMPTATDMLTNGASLTNTGPAHFNSDYLTWPLAQARTGWFMAGVSTDGYLRVFTRSDQAQNSPGWFAVYNLGDRTPVGTGPSSMSLVAMGPSFAYGPFRWCGIHSVTPPVPGWQGISGDPTAFSGAQWGFSGTITAAVDTALSACPANSFGVTGSLCSTIPVSTLQPVRSQDGAGLLTISPGDFILADTEKMRVLQVIDSTHVSVQRAYTGVGPNSHSSGTAFIMQCSQLNPANSQTGYWDFLDDPLGKNLSGTTVLSDPNAPGGHLGGNDSLQIGSGAGGYIPYIGQSRCPDAVFAGNGAACYELRSGSGVSLINAPVQALANTPLFAGTHGAGGPNDVDSHPSGNCAAQWCADGRPNIDWTVGSQIGFATATSLGSGIWKFTAAQGVQLHRKQLPTAGYAGRIPLVDVSGPGSDITAHANTFCLALASGECKSGSAASEIYVNAPQASSGGCPFAGIGNQGDDTDRLCLLDAHVSGNAWQVGTAGQDMTGSRNRTMGTLFSRWNQHGVFWNLNGPPNGSVLFSLARWLDGVRSEDLATFMPPYPAPDGVARSGYVPITVGIPAPSNGAVTNAVVEFGYADNGDPGSFFCTSRAEPCIAVNSTDAANPFYFEISDTYSGVSCAGGCKVSIPALSNRVLYYRVKLRDSGGSTLVTGPMSVVLIR